MDFWVLRITPLQKDQELVVVATLAGGYWGVTLLFQA
jgi:hypothetical protein